MRRHLTESCLSGKYTIKGTLLKFIIENPKMSQTIDNINKNFIKPKLKLKNNSVLESTSLINSDKVNNDEELYSNYINERKIITDNTSNKIVYECIICNNLFKDKNTITNHINEIHIDTIIQSSSDDFLKQYEKLSICNNNVNHEFNERNASSILKRISQLEEKMEHKLEQTKHELSGNIKQINGNIEDIRKRPTTINQNLQVLCLDPEKNCLDTLTERYGNFHQALEFVKDCALSQITGDVRLIEEVYLNSDHHPAFWYMDKKRQKIGWMDEKGQTNIDMGGKVVFRKLVSNLQNGYLKGVNYLINKNLDEKRCPNKFLAD